MMSKGGEFTFVDYPAFRVFGTCTLCTATASQGRTMALLDPTGRSCKHVALLTEGDAVCGVAAESFAISCPFPLHFQFFRR
jgi:hypothetical protein